MSEASKTSKVDPGSVFGLFNAKREDAFKKLARTFIAFVPVAGGKKGESIGYVFYAAPTEFGQHRTPNFQLFHVGASSGQVREAESIIDNLESEELLTHGPKDFHAISAISLLAQYARLKLEWREKPQAFCVESIAIDCAGDVFGQDFEGDYKKHSGGITKVGSIFSVGCYDKEIRSQVMEILKEGISGKKVAKHKLNGIVLRIQKIVELPHVGCVELSNG